MYLSTDCFSETLCHGWIAVRHVQIDQARSAADHRIHHADHCLTQRFFERRKRRDVTGTLSLVGSLRRLRAFGRAGTLLGDDTLAQKSASTVLRQTFGAYNPRKKCLVSEILFDRSQRLLSWPETSSASASSNRSSGRNSAPEIPLPKPCGLGKASASARGYPTPGTGRPKRKSLRSKYVRRKNANTGENRTCVVHRRTAAVNGTPGLSESGRNGRSPQRLGRINHGKILARTLHQEVRSQRRRRKKFRLKNTFADVDGITRQDEKTSAVSLGEALRINLENLIAAGVLSSHRNSFRRRRCAYIHQPKRSPPVDRYRSGLPSGISLLPGRFT